DCTRQLVPRAPVHEMEVRGYMTAKERTLGQSQRDELLATLKARFEEHMDRHRGIQWEEVRLKLERNSDKLWSLGEMERSGGEPDVTGQDRNTGEYLFMDCSAESPKGRRSVCYDREALEARKKHKPDGSAVEMATAMGAVLLSEEEYRKLQKLGEFDTKTSSWLQTPPDIRRLGGAIFGDYRFGTVWVYHNGAESYYAARGFRCALRV
ncbi:MAG TPA: DUF4256 domain-containing protein, partial [Gemmatimonadaceae bacterium]